MYIMRHTYVRLYIHTYGNMHTYDCTYSCMFISLQHIHTYACTYACNFISICTYVRTPVLPHIRSYIQIHLYVPRTHAVQQYVRTLTHTYSRWILIDRQNIWLRYASSNVSQAHAMHTTHHCDCARKVVLVVMNCSDDTFVWLAVNFDLNSICSTSHCYLFESSLN